MEYFKSMDEQETLVVGPSVQKIKKYLVLWLENK